MWKEIFESISPKKKQKQFDLIDFAILKAVQAQRLD